MAERRVVPLLSGLVLAVAACGSPDAGPTPAALAERSGCTQFTATETDEVGVLEQGRCFVGSHPVVLSTFSNNEIRDLWLRGVEDDGGSLVVGDRFVGYSGSPDAAAAVAESLGAVTREPS